MEGLTEGRMVHFVPMNSDGTPSSRHWAAIVTRVWDLEGMVNLAAFDDYKVQFLGSIQYSEVPRYNTWHWIERS